MVVLCAVVLVVHLGRDDAGEEVDRFLGEEEVTEAATEEEAIVQIGRRREVVSQILLVAGVRT